MEEVEIEIVLNELPDVPGLIEGLGAHMDMVPESLGMTSTYDRLVDTADFALLAKDHTLRVRQKLENVYGGSEFRLTYKFPLREHDRLFIRREKKLTVPQTEYDKVLELLSSLVSGVTDDRLEATLVIEELAREVNLGPKGAQLNIAVDECRYSLPDAPDDESLEYVLEIESHGVSDDTVLKAADWVLKQTGGREAKQCKYARGLRKLGRL